MSNKVQKITPFLWYNDRAEEAARFYVSVFKDAKIGKITRYGEEAVEASGMPAGTVMTVEFELEGQVFTALNGGPTFTFTPAISFVVNCDTQEEVDHYWEKLSDGGRKDQCGWLTDRFGVSWQIVPATLIELLSDPDPARSGRVMQAMLQMTKIEIDKLKQAYEQE